MKPCTAVMSPLSTLISKTIPLRSEVNPEDTWDLTFLFSSDEDWEKSFETLQSSYKQILKFQGQFSKSPDVLKSCLEFKKEIDLLAQRLHEYSRLRVSEDSSNTHALEREARYLNFTLQLQKTFSFITPEIHKIPDEIFSNWLLEPSLQEWRTALHKIRRTKPHTLSESEERLLALAGGSGDLGTVSSTGGVLASPIEMFSQLTDVDMKFGSVKDEEGKMVELTFNTYRSFLTNPHREIRKEAFEKYYTEFSEHRYSLTATLAGSVRKDVFLARARNFPSAREASLFYEDIPISVYDNLIATVRKNLPTLHRYYALRKQVLGYSELHEYDNHIPLVDSIRTDISFQEAIEKILAAVAPLGEEYVTILREGLTTKRWCDRYENKGKCSGAFSSGTYSTPTYILMNYKQDLLYDLYTLVHEAGHSLHTWYSSKSQNFQNYEYPLFLAEVASTFNEMLLTEYLLKETTDPHLRAYIINNQIDEFRNTLFRNTMLAEFEKIIHEAEENGKALTLEFFRTSYRSLLEIHYGNQVIIDDLLDLDSLRIPHFYYPFYMYKYSIGISAAVGLFHNLIKNKNTTPYLNFLRSGSSQFPIPTLQKAGVDMNSPEPIQNALDLFAERVNQLEVLLIDGSLIAK